MSWWCHCNRDRKSGLLIHVFPFHILHIFDSKQIHKCYYCCTCTWQTINSSLSWWIERNFIFWWHRSKCTRYITQHYNQETVSNFPEVIVLSMELSLFLKSSESLQIALTSEEEENLLVLWKSMKSYDFYFIRIMDPDPTSSLDMMFTSFIRLN